MLPPCDEFWDRRRRILISTIADRFEQNRTFSIERQPTSSRTMEGNSRSWEATGAYLGLPGATRAYEKCMRRFSNAFYLHETLLFFRHSIFGGGLPGATSGDRKSRESAIVLRREVRTPLVQALFGEQKQ